MKVVYVVSLFPCWSETFIVREINELIAAGVDVRIVSLKQPCEAMVQSDAKALLDRVIYPQPPLRGSLTALRELLRNPGLAVRDLALLTRSMAAEPSKLLKSIIAWWRTLARVDTVRSLDATWLHAHWATYPTTAAQTLAPRVGLPFSFTCHAHDIFVERQFIAAKLAQAAFAVTISKFNVEFLAERYGSVAHEKLKVIHCGVVPAEIPFVELHDTARQSGLIVSVGRLDAIKGFETLIAACEILARDGLIFQCILVGEGPLRPALQAQIDRAGLGRQITMPGAQPAEAVRELMSQANLFILPSRVTPEGDRDGIPVALMEAMAAGTPVVSTTVSGIPELIESGVNGSLVPPDDAVRLAKAMREQMTRMVDEPALAARMTAAGRARIDLEFNVAIESAKLLQAFIEAAGAGEARPFAGPSTNAGETAGSKV